MIAGVDGCREGWVGVWLDQSGAVAGATSSDSLEKVLQSIPELKIAGIVNFIFVVTRFKIT